MAEKTKKLTQSEIDGVQYRRAKLWQIILCACNSLIGMSIYSLIGLASYSASIGYGIGTAMVGIILTATRILDGVTDPLIAFIFDRVNTRFGKIRILMVTGFVIEALALLAMYNFMSSKGFGLITFTVLYIIYIIGYTINNMTGQVLGPALTNDPKQRPMVGVWSTALNYIVPMAMSIVLNVVLLPMFGGTYNQEFLSAACWLCIAMGTVGIILVCIGITPNDKPEMFEGTIAKQKHLTFKDMADVLKGNRPLQCYIVAATSDKIAQQTAAQAIVGTMLFGIIIGDMGLSAILGALGMLPSILFAIVGARYAGKHGSMKGIITWTKISIVIGIAMLIFFVIIDPKQIAKMGPVMILYVLFTLVWNGAKMCVTTANSSFMADIIDYELDRSGRYIPTVVTGTSSLIDKLVSSFSAVIATGSVALIGYRASMPQPGEEMTSAIFWLTMAIYFGLPILGWICTLFIMKFCKLNKEEMVNVQKRIAEKKKIMKKEVVKAHLQ